LTGRTFFPELISSAFKHGLLIAFGASIVMLLIAAVASLLRGERFVHDDAADGVLQSAAGDPDAPSHESIGQAVAREAAALDGIPQQDVAYEEAVQAAGATDPDLIRTVRGDRG
jgi:hypothetical protein